MQLVGCDDHDSVELGGGEHLLIISEDQRYPSSASYLCRTLPIPPAERDDLGVRVALETAQVHPLGIACGSDHTNPNATFLHLVAFPRERGSARQPVG